MELNICVKLKLLTQTCGRNHCYLQATERPLIFLFAADGSGFSKCNSVQNYDLANILAIELISTNLYRNSINAVEEVVLCISGRSYIN